MVGLLLEERVLLQNQDDLNNLFFLFALHRVRCSKIDGAEYRKAAVVLCHFEDGMPVFGEIVDTIITPLKECILIMHPLVADYFDKHFHAYHTIPFRDRVIVCCHSQLHDHQVLHTNLIHSTTDHSLYV